MADSGNVLKKLALTVNHVDNELIVIVSGRLAFDLGLNNDPPVNQQVDLTPMLQQGSNHVLVLGINWDGPAHFVGQLAGVDNSGNSFVVGSWNVGPTPAGQGKAFQWEFDVIKI